jgi:putative membrane protein
VTLDAVSNYDFALLTPLFLGLILGILGTTKILERLLNQHPGPTYLLILGFMLASVWELFPGIPVGWEWLFCIASFTAGGGIIRIILRFEQE